jgi:Xaa-Pro aminopeptidase
MLDYLLNQGFEAGSEFISIYDSSNEKRPHTEPMGADLIVLEGDLVICDATVAGPGGYYSDFARTFSRGEPATASQARYREAYESLQAALPLIKPGPCTELFARFGKHSAARLPGLDGFHGVGLCIYEAPWLRGGDPEEYQVTLEENMIIALEINHNPVKLEHLLRVKDNGVEILSNYQLDPELVST